VEQEYPPQVTLSSDPDARSNTSRPKASASLIKLKQAIAQRAIQDLVKAPGVPKPAELQALKDLIQATHAKDPVRIWAAEALQNVLKPAGDKGREALRAVLKSMGGKFAEEPLRGSGPKKTEHVPRGFKECDQKRSCILDRAAEGINAGIDFSTGFGLGEHGFRMLPFTLFRVKEGEYELWMQLKHLWKIGQDDTVNICFRLKEKADFEKRRERLQTTKQSAQKVAACRPAFDRALLFAEKHRAHWLSFAAVLQQLRSQVKSFNPMDFVKTEKDRAEVAREFEKVQKQVSKAEWEACFKRASQAVEDTLYLETRYDLSALDVAKMEGLTFRAIAAVANFPFKIMSMAGVPLASLGTLVVGKIYQSRDLSWKEAIDAFALDLAYDMIKGRLAPSDLAKKAVPKRKNLRPQDVARLGAFAAGELVCPPTRLKKAIQTHEALFDVVQGFR
jgi:hypothetical protein